MSNDDRIDKEFERWWDHFRDTTQTAVFLLVFWLLTLVVPDWHLTWGTLAVTVAVCYLWDYLGWRRSEKKRAKETVR